MKISKEGIVIIIFLVIIAMFFIYLIANDVADKVKMKTEAYKKQLNAISKAIKDADIDGVTAETIKYEVKDEEVFILIVKKGDDPEVTYVINPGGHAEKHSRGSVEYIYWGSIGKK